MNWSELQKGDHCRMRCHAQQQNAKKKSGIPFSEQCSHNSQEKKRKNQLFSWNENTEKKAQ